MKSLSVFAVVLLAASLAGDVSAQEQERGPLRRFPGLRPRNAPVPASRSAGADADSSAASAGSRAFEAAPVEMVYKVYSEMVGRTILVDPATPKPAITLKNDSKQTFTDAEWIEAIEVVLEMNGIHLEPYGEKFIRALPRKDVRKEGIPLIMDAETRLADSGRVVSMMIPFKNISTEEAQKALEGFKSNSGILLVFERTNSILVTDTQQNINRMLEIAKTIDVASPVLENVFVRQIKNAAANDIKTALETIVQESQKEQEQSGKKVNAAAQQPRTMLGGRLLGRNQPAAQPAAVNNASLVMSVSDADRGMIRGKVLILSDERSNKLIIVTQKSNMDFFDKVIEQLDVETTPDTVVKVYRLKYAEAEEVSDMINDLIGNAPSSKNSGKQNQNQASKSGSGGNLTRNQPAAARKNSANQRTGEAKAGELSKDNTTVLADKRINGLVVMTNKELVPVVESIIESMDVKLSQVLIETVIIEVSLGDTLRTGVDWVMGGKVAESAFLNHGQMIGGGAGSTEIAKFVGATTNAVNPIGSGLNYFVKSDKLNLSAVIDASKTDSRTKYVASPIVMTVDNKEATIEATSSRKFVEDWQQSTGSGYYGSGMPSPKYTTKDIGITLKITPKINPNGTVMLEVEEEYSQVGGTQSMLVPEGESYTSKDIEISATRKMAADIILENGQSVILGGLTTKNISDKEAGIPILKDIPYIGKWLFGSVDKDENRSELLIFMTPYVLDDAEVAQAEALRRKKTLSDPNPWEDGGWSASDLADPVSQKEQLRRLKDEWKKQDAERKARQAIEQEKLNRAKKLKELSAEERAVWLKMHKEELEKEEQEELEKKMLDKDSQEGLKKLVEEIKKGKLESAQKEIDEAEERARAENGRAELDKAKAEKGAER